MSRKLDLHRSLFPKLSRLRPRVAISVISPRARLRSFCLFLFLVERLYLASCICILYHPRRQAYECRFYSQEGYPRVRLERVARDSQPNKVGREFAVFLSSLFLQFFNYFPLIYPRSAFHHPGHPHHSRFFRSPGFSPCASHSQYSFSKIGSLFTHCT